MPPVIQHVGESGVRRMGRATSWLLASLLVAVVLFRLSVAKRPIETGYPSCKLLTGITNWKRDTLNAGDNFALKPEWIGTVKRLYLRDTVGIYKEDIPEDIRLNSLMITFSRHQREPDLLVARAQRSPEGHVGFAARESARYVEKLPRSHALAGAIRLSELETMLGPQRHGSISGWGDSSGQIHTSALWTAFTMEGQDQLRFLHIFCHITRAPNSEDAAIDTIEIRGGTFRPADPNSFEERQQFRSGDDLAQEQKVVDIASMARIPQPLRSLIEARNAPDDFDMTAYVRALNAIRDKPDPRLFEQLVERADESTLAYANCLRDILLNDNGAIQVSPWRRSSRMKAIRATVDALPRQKTRLGAEDVLMIVLAAQGGGKMQLEIPAAKATVTLECERLPGGERKSFDSTGITDANLHIVMAACRKWLLERYPDLSTQ